MSRSFCDPENVSAFGARNGVPMQKVWNMADQIPVAPGSANACPVFSDPHTVTKELKIPAWCGDASGHA